MLQPKPVLWLHTSLEKRNEPFSDGEFIKECMPDIANSMCPEHKTKMDSIALSKKTGFKRAEKISDDLMSQRKDTNKQFLLYSLTLDESTDVQDTAQLLVFIRGMGANFQLTENILSVESLKTQQLVRTCFMLLKTAMQELGWSGITWQV